MPNADNTQYVGQMGLLSIPERLRLYAQNREVFKFWVLRQRYNLSFLKVITEKFGTVPATDLTDWEFRYPEFAGIETFFNIKSGSNNADRTIFSVENSVAAMLRDTNRAMVQGIFAKANPTAHTDFSTSRSPASGIVYPEVIRIIQVDAENTDGAGYTKVKILRGHPSDSITSVASVPEITSSMRISLANLVSRENSTVGVPFYKTSKYLSNVLQISRHPYGITEMMNVGGGIETFLAKGEQYLDLTYDVAERYYMETIEKALLLGKRSKKVVGGSHEYETGGILEFIGSANNYSNVSDFVIDLEGQVPTQQKLNEIFSRLSRTLSVSEVWVFLDRNASLAITNALEGKLNYITNNGQLTLNYDMKVQTYEGVGVPMTIHMVVAPVLNEIGYDNTALVLNLNQLNQDEAFKMGTFQIAHKVPFSDLPENAESYQMDTGYKGKIREFYGVWGLVRRLPETHAMIINFPAPNY